MSNEKLGMEFEEELNQLLKMCGFWSHRMVKSKEGQPADIIAVKDGKAALIDAKRVSTSRGFALSRIEENQEYAMSLWKHTGNGDGWFAIQIPNKQIYFFTYWYLIMARDVQSVLSVEEIERDGIPIKKWVKKFG